jgi:hypothetical protein
MTCFVLLVMEPLLVLVAVRSPMLSCAVQVLVSAHHLVQRSENYAYKVSRQIDAPHYERARTPYETNEVVGFTRVFDHGGTLNLHLIVTQASRVAKIIGMTGPELINGFTEALIQ